MNSIDDFELLRGIKSDTQRYIEGELWWWEVRDDDVHTTKRIEECNKVDCRLNYFVLFSSLIIDFYLFEKFFSFEKPF